MRRRLIIIFAVCLVGLVGTALYVANTDLGRFKGSVESIASKSLGHELRVAGDFSLRVGRTLQIRATDVSVANASWAQDPTMLQAGKVALDLELWSLIFGPIRAQRIDLQDITLRLQENGDGLRNWDPATGRDHAKPARAASGSNFPAIDQLELRNARIEFVAPHLTGKTDIVVDTATYSIGDSSLTVKVTAKVNNVPLDIKTEISPWNRRYTMESVVIDSDATLGRITANVHADVADFRSLAVSSADVKVDGPDVAYLLSVLKLPEFASGPLQLKATLEPGTEQPTFEASGQFGEYRVAADGWVRSFRGDGGFDTQIDVKGPDLAVLGERLGTDILPAAPFEISGRLLSMPDGIKFENAKIDVGKVSFSGQGQVAGLDSDRKTVDVLANFESSKARLAVTTRSGWLWNDVEIDFDAEGPNASEPIGKLRFGMLPPTPFKISGKGRYSDKSLDLDTASIQIEEVGELQGSVGFSHHERPFLDVRLQSTNFRFPTRSKSKEPGNETGSKDRLIPDFTIPFEYLPRFDADVDIAADGVTGDAIDGASARLQAQLREGRLDISSFEANGRRGRLKGSLVAEPKASTYEITLDLRGQELYIAPLDEPTATFLARPQFELTAKLNATGANMRDLASTLTGTLRATGGAGKIPERAGQLSGIFVEDLLTRVAKTINPLTEEADSLDLSCLVLNTNINDGIIENEPLLALQTPDLDVLAGGRIDLRTESLDLDFVAQPRKGLGVGLGDIVQPFTRVGGTLAAPKIVADATSGILHTGAGIATGGLFSLANSLRKRFLGGNPCEKALQAIADDESSPP